MRRLVLLALLGLGSLALVIWLRDLAWLRGAALPVWIFSTAYPLRGVNRWWATLVALLLFDFSFAGVLRDTAQWGVGRLLLSLSILGLANLLFVWTDRRIMRQEAAKIAISRQSSGRP